MKKSKAKKQSSSKSAALPAGFTAVAVGGSFGETHDFRKVAVITGKVVGVDKVMQERDVWVNGKKKTKEMPVRIIRVAKENGSIASVWESHQLKDVFDAAKKGKMVYIKYLGQKKLPAVKKGAPARKVNLFSAGIK